MNVPSIQTDGATYISAACTCGFHGKASMSLEEMRVKKLKEMHAAHDPTCRRLDLLLKTHAQPK